MRAPRLPGADRLRAAADRLGGRLGLAPDARGLGRLFGASALAFAATAFFPDRSRPVPREVAAWTAVALWTFLYAQGHRVVRDGPPRPGLVLALGAAVAAVAVAGWPFHSADVYAYGNAGWLEARYGLDPYVHVPQDLPGWRADPMWNDLWTDRIPPYGFLFAHVARAVAWAGGGDPALAAAIFRALGAATLVATGALALDTARRLGRARPDATLHLVLWSPFLLVHHVVNAHNDLLLGALVVVAVRACAQGRWLLPLPALLLGALVKGAAIVAVPFAFVHLARRHGLARACGGLGVGLAAAALVALPYLRDAGEIRWSALGASLAAPSGSLAAAALGLFAAAARAWPALAPAAAPLRTSLLALLALGLGALVGARTARAIRRPAYDVEAFLEDAVLALVALVCVGSGKFGAWYVAMFLPAAALLPEGHRLRRLALALSLFALLPITFVGRAKILDGLVVVGLPLLLVGRGRRAGAVPAPAASGR